MAEGNTLHNQGFRTSVFLPSDEYDLLNPISTIRTSGRKYLKLSNAALDL